MGKIFETMTALADAIRLKVGHTGKLTGEQMLGKLAATIRPEDGGFVSRSLTSITIPDGVDVIGDYAFYNSYISSVKLSDSVTEIGGFAFHDCPFLVSVMLSDGVVVIRDHAFRECKSLTSITIPNSVKEISLTAFLFCTIHFRFRCSESEVPDGYPWGAESATAEYNYTGE